jgi:hypothetical protein
MANELNRRNGLRLPVACSVLTLAVWVAAALGGSIEHGRLGVLAASALAVAALTCWVSATVALVLSARLAGTRWAVPGIMAAGLVRFSLPLVVVAASALVQGPLSRAGLFGYMVGFFLLALIVETLLLVAMIRTTEAAAAVAWKGL